MAKAKPKKHSSSQHRHIIYFECAVLFGLVYTLIMGLLVDHHVPLTNSTPIGLTFTLIGVIYAALLLYSIIVIDNDLRNPLKRQKTREEKHAKRWAFATDILRILQLISLLGLILFAEGGLFTFSHLNPHYTIVYTTFNRILIGLLFSIVVFLIFFSMMCYWENKAHDTKQHQQTDSPSIPTKYLSKEGFPVAPTPGHGFSIKTSTQK